MANLPQAVYDAWADPDVHTYTMPVGTYQITGTTKLDRHFSDFTADFTGCILEANPNNTGDWPNNDFYPLSAFSITDDSVIYSTSPGSVTRRISGLSGVVTAGTTQLTMISGEVIMDLAVGEEVILQLGVDTADPVEPYVYKTAIIQSVNTGTGVITFSAPLGVNVPDYVDEAGLKAATDPSLWFKIGDWGDWPPLHPGNFSKGYGSGHGMERYVGGLTSNVEFNNVTLNLTSNLNISTIPNGIWPVNGYAVRDWRINGLTVTNPVGNMLMLFKCFDCTFDGITVTGQGISKPGGGFVANAHILAMWGGGNNRYRNVSIHGNDMDCFSEEVGATGVELDGLDFDVVYTNIHTTGSPPVIFGFFSATENPVIHNAKIKASTAAGGPQFNYASFTPIRYTGYLKFVGEYLNDYLDFGYQKFPELMGTVTVGLKSYGLIRDKLDTLIIPNISGAHYDLPFTGLVLPGARFRVTTVGDCRAVSDSFGTTYWASAPTPNVWKTLESADWHLIPPGASLLQEYVDKYLRFWFNDTASDLPATVEIEYRYMPLRAEPRKKFNT